MTTTIQNVFHVECDRCFWRIETADEGNAQAWADEHDDLHESEVS